LSAIEVFRDSTKRDLFEPDANDAGRSLLRTSRRFGCRGKSGCLRAGATSWTREEGLGHAGEQGEENEGRGKRRDHAYRFEAHERDAVFGYYTNPSRGLPPGLAKRGGSLPPGLEKQLVRNGTLPPGLEKRLEPLPVELERQLPPLAAGCGCRRGVVGTNVVLIRTRDHFVLDVFHISGR